MPQLGTMMPTKEREESIPSFENGRSQASLRSLARAVQRRRWLSYEATCKFATDENRVDISALGMIPATAAYADTPFADRLTGDWEGARTSMGERGVTTDLDWSNYYQGEVRRRVGRRALLRFHRRARRASASTCSMSIRRRERTRTREAQACS